MSKFNVNISGGSGHIFMADQAQIDIRDGDCRRPTAERRQPPIVSVKPKGPDFVSRPEMHQPPVHAQESHGTNPVYCKIKQGFALILHNKYFPKGTLGDREGSENDVEAIKEFCKHARLRVNDTDRKTEDLTATQMEDLCNEMSKRAFDRYDAFVCFILSHGTEDGIYGIDDNTLSLQEIVDKFKDCESLAGKPKLFFIQACRGSHKDGGIEVQSDSHPVNRPPRFRLPCSSDILIAQSSVDGFVSYRDRKAGSWFMGTLMDKLEKHAHNMHLMDILTLVNHAVAGKATPDQKKQMPCQMSTLTKFVYFDYPHPLES